MIISSMPPAGNGDVREIVALIEELRLPGHHLRLLGFVINTYSGRGPALRIAPVETNDARQVMFFISVHNAAPPLAP
jgi:hypothetical protein